MPFKLFKKYWVYLLCSPKYFIQIRVFIFEIVFVHSCFRPWVVYSGFGLIRVQSLEFITIEVHLFFLYILTWGYFYLVIRSGPFERTTYESITCRYLRNLIRHLSKCIYCGRRIGRRDRSLCASHRFSCGRGYAAQWDRAFQPKIPARFYMISPWDSRSCTNLKHLLRDTTPIIL